MDPENNSFLYSIESLRYAFNRFALADNLTCIITINNESYLSVKVVED